MNETLRRILNYGVKNYLRNGWLSVAATLMVAMTLFIVSVFALNAYATKQATLSIESKLDMAIYITDKPSEEAVTDFVADVKAYPEVSETQYLDKTQLIAEFQKGDYQDAIKQQVNTENNPLPRTLKVKAHDPTQFDAIDQKIKESAFAKDGNIRSLSYGKNRTLIQGLITQSQKINRNGLIIGSIFTVIAVLFIYNTVRLIIRFRNDEIAIMKLVGATNTYVRGPFIVEGALYGLVAGIVTLIALYFYLQNGLPEGASLAASPNTEIAKTVYSFYVDHIYTIGFALIGGAVFLSVLCTGISVQYHLKK